MEHCSEVTSLYVVTSATTRHEILSSRDSPLVEGVTFWGILKGFNFRKTSFWTAKRLEEKSAGFFKVKELLFLLFELKSFPSMKRIASVCHVWPKSYDV